MNTPDATHTYFDYIVIGGGAAGCVVASRLSEDASVRVCLLEAGGPDDSVLIHAPMGFAISAPLKIHNWGYETTPQAGFNGRKGYQPRGKVMGGSTSINAMVYTRGHRSDYDHWASLGNPVGITTRCFLISKNQKTTCALVRTRTAEWAGRCL